MLVSHTRKLVKLVALLGLLVLVVGMDAAPARADKYALLIGVRRYGHGLDSLNYTEADMVDLARTLQGCGYRPENIVLMTQAAAAEKGARFEPQSDRIRAELRRLVQGRTSADTVLVGFSGHGLQLERGKSEFYFCPADTDLQHSRTVLSLTEVYGALERCQAGFKFLMADACRNDPFAEAARARGIKGADGVTRPQPQVQPVPGGIAAFFACSKGEEAYEEGRLGHGVFFYYVIKGLSGEAASPGTREVTLAGLQQYVTRNVSDYVTTHHRGKNQVPELRNQTRGLVALVPDPVKELSGLLARGRALSRRNEADKALAAYTEAVRLDANSAEAHACRADALNDKGAYDQALAECERALRLNPRLAVAFEYRADAYLGKRKFDLASQAIAQALEINPRLAGAYNDRGVLLALQGRPDKAVTELTKALELDPNDYRVYGNRASVYADLGEYAKAVSDYTEALRLGPRDPAAYFARSEAHKKLGHAEQAEVDRAVAAQLGFKVAKK
jgi:tetratricopeptide (TPR) repeat protein